MGSSRFSFQLLLLIRSTASIVFVKAPLLLTIAPVLAAFFSSTAGAINQQRIHPGVHRTLRAQGTVNLTVSFKDSTESVLQSVQETKFATRSAKITHLEAHASTSQAPLNELLKKSSNLKTSTIANSSTPLFKSKQSFWIINQMYFEAATFALVEKLPTLDSVTDVREEEVFPLPAPIASRAVNMSNTDEAVGILANQ